MEEVQKVNRPFQSRKGYVSGSQSETQSGGFKCSSSSGLNLIHGFTATVGYARGLPYFQFSIVIPKKSCHSVVHPSIHQFTGTAPRRGKSRGIRSGRDRL